MSHLRTQFSLLRMRYRFAEHEYEYKTAGTAKPGEFSPAERVVYDRTYAHYILGGAAVSLRSESSPPAKPEVFSGK